MTSATVLFQPKGDTPEWAMVYDKLLDTAQFGDIITYEQLDEALGRRFLDSRSPIYRARHELGAVRSRWLDAVPSVGYRVIEAREHMRVAQRHKTRAKRQLGMMVHVAQVTDITRLTPEELATFDNQQKLNAMLYQVAVHHEKRISRVETALRQAGLL